MILKVFGLFNFTIGAFIGGTFLVMAVTIWKTGNIDPTVKIVKEAIVPLIDAIKGFAATIFLPIILAFSGYYFGRSRD